MKRPKKLTVFPGGPPARQLTTEEAIQVFSMILTQWALLEDLDRLKHTNFYRHKIKLLTNQLIPELENALSSKAADIYGIQDEAFHNLLDHKKEVVRKISSLRPELQAGFNELLTQYLNAPELVMHRNGISIQGE